MGLENSHSATDIEVVRFLLGYNPDALSSTGQTPLHIACNSKHITLHTVELLLDAFPESIRHEDNSGCMPLHLFCGTKNLDDGAGLDILKLLLEKCPESVRHATTEGDLPIYLAAALQSPEFCRTLIEAYPGSERITRDDGVLLFHFACGNNTLATVKYLYELYPESMNVATNLGYYPIHFAIWGINRRKESPETAIEVLQFLLDCDPNAASLKLFRKFPLYWVCYGATRFTPKLNVYLKILQILYDTHPEAIESNEVASNVGKFCQEVQTYINTQITYARQARDLRQMNTPFETGQLPLHKALRDNVTLGSIKLLVKGNPSAICTFDNRGMIPLHVACQHQETPAVVEYLINLNKATLTSDDWEGNTVLHHGCRGANHAIIALLLDRYGSMSVSKRNAHRQLPIDLLFQNKNEVSDKESVKVFTESVYRLLRANPETLMHYDLGQTRSEDCLSQQNMKRKIDEV